MVAVLFYPLFMRILFTTILFTIIHTAFAQNPTLKNWYYGYGNHLNFQTVVPTYTDTGSTHSANASSTISDLCGNLLFYCSNGTIFNRNHQVMLNGNGLLHSDYSKTILIVPYQESQTKYYVCTQYFIPELLSYEIYYTIVDMSMDDGNGAVTSKNNLLSTNSEQGMTATHHANGNDIWFVTHTSNSPNYNAYIITNFGISNTPVVSIYSGNHSAWFPKFSSRGNKMLMSNYTTDVVTLFDFNKETGQLSFAEAFENYNPFDYCISEDETKIYLINFDLLQIDLLNSQTSLLSSKSLYGLQIGHDDKIYTSDGSKLYVINKPNFPGTSCDFQNLNISCGSGIDGISLFESKGNDILNNLINLTIEHE